MKEMNTTETNKKFAEFLGLTSEQGTLKFESDWNALMLVVERIEETNEGTIIIDSKNIVSISFGGNTYKFFDDNLIGNAYNACNMFINWYNERTKEEKK